jgi:hypothetical protein
MPALVTKRTPHPCAGMTRAQRRDFELIAINQRPRGGRMTVDVLLKRGLIEEMEPEVIAQSALGPIMAPQYCVPLRHHYQWCKWASEQPRKEDD